jgi:hypothetical protein
VGQRSLWVLLGILALAPRLLEVLTEPAYLHPDALHQGLEPAFRLVHGFGQETWEWKGGLRSWMWPGVLALPMWLLNAVGLSGPGAGMGLSVAASRALVAVIDVAGVLLAARLCAHFAGRWAAIATVGVLSLHPAQVVTGAQPLIDVPAATCLVWACERAFATDRIDGRRGLWLGIALGLTAMLRVQLLPAVAIVPLALRFASGPSVERSGWKRTAVGFVVVLLAAGTLDWVTWGTPFHSIVEYLRFNLEEGQTAMGIMPALRYWDHFIVTSDVAAPLLLTLGLIGGLKHRGLALVFLAVIVPHQLVPYKVWRFIYPATVILFVLATLGGARLVAAAHQRDAKRAQLVAVGLGLWMLLGSVRTSINESIWQTTWLHNQGGDEAVAASRGLNRAYLELGKREQLRGVVQTVLPRNGAPGMALLGHDVPTIHPLGTRVPQAPIEVAEFWIVREVDGQRLADPSLAVWRDEDSGVVIYPAPRAR